MVRLKLILITLLLVGCSVVPKYRTIEGFAQGTTYQITYQGNADYQSEVEDLLQRFDSSLSVYKEGSLINAINDNLTDSLDEWTRRVIEISMQAHSLTEGLFDPTLAPLIAAYGFARKEQQSDITQQQREEIMASVGMDRIAISSGGKLIKESETTELNFNAIAQGYSVDLLAEHLEALGVENYMVEVGGEIFCAGHSPRGSAWRIGIDTPYQGNMVKGGDIATVVELSGRGLATSGNYRKFLDTPSGERITHTIDPRSGLSTSHNLLSATLIAPSAALADALATACMVGGLEWSKSLVERLKQSSMEVDCYLIYADSNGEMQSYSTL